MNDRVMVAVKEIYLETDPGKGNMVILKEVAEADQFFLMFVGDSEFAAIAKEKGYVEPKRPLTHDMYQQILKRVPVEFLRVEIHDMQEETYFANVVFRSEGVEHVIDCRPSDAVALALKMGVPIMVNQALFRRKLSQEQIKEYEGLVKKVKF
jgi:bifunctional DNase/RNase